jgi:excisionase family DNA binding protein
VQKLFTIKDAAKTLSVSPEFLKRLQRQDLLRVVHLGRRSVRVSEAEIDRLCREGFQR